MAQYTSLQHCPRGYNYQIDYNGWPYRLQSENIDVRVEVEKVIANFVDDCLNRGQEWGWLFDKDGQPVAKYVRGKEVIKII